MATMFSSSLRPDASIASNIQGWAGWFESALTTIGGWTVTADTGQTLPASLTGATAQFQKKGYRIYQMNDAFTTANPIYMRVDYGGGFAASTPPGYGPAMWISFGTGTDGAGNLTGLLWDGVGFAGSGQGAPTVLGNNTYQLNNYDTRNYASADSSRFIVGMFVNSFLNPANNLGSDQICFSLERSRDINGNYTADGLLITYTDTQLIGGGGITESLGATKYLICNRGGRAQPPLEKGLSFPFIVHSPAFSFDGTIPAAIPSHFRGVAQQPGINIAVTGRNDLAPEGQFQMSIYGVNHIYQHLGYLVAVKAIAGPLGSAAGLNDGGTRICMVYD